MYIYGDQRFCEPVKRTARCCVRRTEFRLGQRKSSASSTLCLVRSSLRSSLLSHQEGPETRGRTGHMLPPAGSGLKYACLRSLGVAGWWYRFIRDKLVVLWGTSSNVCIEAHGGRLLKCKFMVAKVVVATNCGILETLGGARFLEFLEGHEYSTREWEACCLFSGFRRNVKLAYGPGRLLNMIGSWK